MIVTSATSRSNHTLNPQQSLTNPTTALAIEILSGVPCNSPASLEHLLRYSLSIADDKDEVIKTALQLFIHTYPHHPDIFLGSLEISSEILLDQLTDSPNGDTIERLMSLWKALAVNDGDYEIILTAAKLSRRQDDKVRLYLYLLNQTDYPLDKIQYVIELLLKDLPACPLAQQVDVCEHFFHSEKSYSSEIKIHVFSLLLRCSRRLDVIEIPLLSSLLLLAGSGEIVTNEEIKQSIISLFNKPFNIVQFESCFECSSLIESLEEIFENDERLTRLKACLGIQILKAFEQEMLRHKDSLQPSNLIFDRILHTFLTCFADDSSIVDQVIVVFKNLNHALKMEFEGISRFDPLKKIRDKRMRKLNRDYQTVKRFHWQVDPPKSKRRISHVEYQVVDGLLKVQIPLIRDHTLGLRILRTIYSSAKVYQLCDDKHKEMLNSKILKFYLKLFPNPNLSDEQMKTYAERMTALFNLNFENGFLFLIRDTLIRLGNHPKVIHQPTLIAQKVKAFITLWNAIQTRSSKKESVIPLLYYAAERQKCPLNAAFGYYSWICALEPSQTAYDKIESLLTSEEMTLSHMNELSLILLKSEKLPKKFILRLLHIHGQARELKLKRLIPILQGLIPHCEKDRAFTEEIKPLVLWLLNKPLKSAVKFLNEGKESFDPFDLRFIGVIESQFTIDHVLASILKGYSPVDAESLKRRLESLVFSEHMRQMKTRLDVLDREEILGYYKFFCGIYEKLSRAANCHHDLISEGWKGFHESVANWHHQVIPAQS